MIFGLEQEIYGTVIPLPSGRLLRPARGDPPDDHHTPRVARAQAGRFSQQRPTGSGAGRHRLPPDRSGRRQPGVPSHHGVSFVRLHQPLCRVHRPRRPPPHSRARRQAQADPNGRPRHHQHRHLPRPPPRLLVRRQPLRHPTGRHHHRRRGRRFQLGGPVVHRGQDHGGGVRGPHHDTVQDPPIPGQCQPDLGGDAGAVYPAQQ